MNATKLGRFSAKACPKWFKVAWQALLADHNGHPERDPKLKKIGLYRAEHSTVRYEGTQTVATPKTRNANIRDGIKELWYKAFKRLAASPK